MCNSLPAKQMPIFCSNHSKSASTFRHRQKFTTCHSAHHENFTEVVEHFISTEKGETCCIKEMCGLYIEKLCKLGNLKDAVSMLGHLHNRQMHPNLHAYNTLLAATGQANCFHIFCDVFRKLLLSKLPPDLTTYRSLAKALLNSSDSVLLGFIREVSEMTAHSDPTVVNRILFATAESGQIDKSLMLFEELKGFKCKIDIVTFNTVLAILGRAGRVDKMLSEYSSMKECGFSPDIVTYDTLINCLRRLGRLDLCRAFAKEMLENGFEMDLLSYTALIDALGRAGHVNDALILFVEMKKFHRPSIYVYRAMIANLKKFGKIQAAVDLQEEMKSSTSKLIGPENFRKKTRDNFRKKRRDGVR
ncbi:hypothetical protein KSP40_PGU019047 [Platanthera guangdongensis]|uniref:Pentatricopeptide repeat-containing protein n=1 Tax=Platanthera guangdongensis TaxID=2320717 RepID=A0ABR2LWY4_9ASPA